MDITVTKDFAKAVGAVHRAVDGRAKTLPMLGHLLLEATVEGRVAISGTDLTTSLRLETAAQVAEPGALALPGQKLAEITHTLPPAASVNLKTDGENAVTLTCGRSRFRLRGLPAGDFPTFPERADAADLLLPATIFADLVAKTSFAASTDQTRYALTGISLQAAADRLRFAATNGHRLAIATLPHKNGEDPLDVIIPPKALVTAAKLASEAGEDITLGFTPGKEHLVLEKDGFIIATRLIEATFPNLDSIVPTTRDHSITANRECLRDAIRRIVPILGDFQGVKLTPGERSLTISGQNGDLGEGTEEIDCLPTGEPAALYCQARYLLDFLDTVSTEQVQLYVTGPLDPILIQPVGDAEYTYIVMPVRGE